MICEFCNATMEERKIYGVFEKDKLIVTCKRCYPVKDKNQKTLKEGMKKSAFQKEIEKDVKRLNEIYKKIFNLKGYENG